MDTTNEKFYRDNSKDILNNTNINLCFNDVFNSKEYEDFNKLLCLKGYDTEKMQTFKLLERKLMNFFIKKS